VDAIIEQVVIWHQCSLGLPPVSGPGSSRKYRPSNRSCHLNVSCSHGNDCRHYDNDQKSVADAVQHQGDSDTVDDDDAADEEEEDADEDGPDPDGHSPTYTMFHSPAIDRYDVYGRPFGFQPCVTKYLDSDSDEDHSDG
jgi:hypothetical protein